MCEELQEGEFDRSLRDDILCNSVLHTFYRRVLGMINWLQGRTQYQIAYAFSRCASAPAAPTIGDVRALNEVVRTVRSMPATLNFWKLEGPLRLLGYPDASFKNNLIKVQRGQTTFLVKPRGRSTDP